MMEFDNLINATKINLSCKNLRDDDLAVIIALLQESKVLQELWLGGNRINLADGKFTDALANNRTLRVLVLGKNQIETEGMKQLANALKVNQTLQGIHLRNNQINDEGAKIFAGALMINKSLQVINLRFNKIGNDGATSLAASIRENKILSQIDLRCNEISASGAKPLADALEMNHTIEILDLEEGNRIGKLMRVRFETIFRDPRRKAKQLEMIIALKDWMMAAKEEEIETLTFENARLKSRAASQGEKIASLESNLGDDRDSEEEEQNDTDVDGYDSEKMENVSNKRLRRVGVDDNDITNDDGDDSGGVIDVTNKQQCSAHHGVHWKRRFEELAFVVGSNRISKSMVSNIRNGSFGHGSKRRKV